MASTDSLKRSIDTLNRDLAAAHKKQTANIRAMQALQQEGERIARDIQTITDKLADEQRTLQKEQLLSAANESEEQSKRKSSWL